jgi:beta-glucosidase
MIELSWAPPANTPDVQIAEAVQAARKAAVAVVFVANKDTEAIDRTTLALPGYQDKLVEAVAAANPRTVVVLDTGGPVLMPWAGKVAGVVQAWYPGEEDGNAAADVLLGDVDPSGRLPITFPKSLADTPANTPEQYPGVDGVATYSEGLRVGYRHYDEKNIEPLFPFGFGLSYTTFAYRHLTVRGHGTDLTVGADITNTGRRTGTEVPQLYVGAPDEPPAQLKGFTKIRLRPGRTRHVTFHLDSRSFASWNTTSHAWQVTGGTYHLMLGAGSRDLRLRREIHLPPTKGR